MFMLGSFSVQLRRTALQSSGTYYSPFDRFRIISNVSSLMYTLPSLTFSLCHHSSQTIKWLMYGSSTSLSGSLLLFQSLSLTIFLSLSMSLSHFLSLFLSLSPFTLSQSLLVSFFLPLSLFLLLSLSSVLYLSLHLSLSFSFSLNLCTPIGYFITCDTILLRKFAHSSA